MVSSDSLEQQFRKSDTIMCNFQSPTPSATGSYGRLADKIHMIFKIQNNQLLALFNKQTAFCSYANAFKLVFSAKAYGKVGF